MHTYIHIYTHTQIYTRRYIQIHIHIRTLWDKHGGAKSLQITVARALYSIKTALYSTKNALYFTKKALYPMHSNLHATAHLFRSLHIAHQFVFF